MYIMYVYFEMVQLSVKLMLKPQCGEASCVGGVMCFIVLPLALVMCVYTMTVFDFY